MTRANVVRGHKAQEAGEDFETFVQRHHTEALRLGIVAGPVEHNEPHPQMIHGKWEMVAAGVADYTGVLYNKVGTTLATEAKSRAKRLYKKELEPKQQRHLDAVVRGGGLAFLLVRLEGIAAAIPWQIVPWNIAKTAESLMVKEIQPWALSIDCKCYLESYCPVRGIPAPGIAGGQQRYYPRE